MSSAASAGILLHDLGDAEAGGPWREVLPPGWLAPDLPGHGSAPAPRHGAYDPMGPATIARWALGGAGVVAGVGENAHAALLVAAGGAAEAAVVIDGLWGEWIDPEAAVAHMYGSLRQVLADAGATSPPPAAGLDPRALHGYGVHMSPDFAARFWGSVTVPVLAVETPSSRTPPSERAERIGWFGGPAELVEVRSGDPATVAAAILDRHPARLVR